MLKITFFLPVVEFKWDSFICIRTQEAKKLKKMNFYFFQTVHLYAFSYSFGQNWHDMVMINVLDQGLVNCLSPGLCCGDEDTCVCVKGAGFLSQKKRDPAPPRFPQGASVETQQPWRECVLGRLLLIWFVVLQSLACDRENKPLWFFTTCIDPLPMPIASRTVSDILTISTIMTS